MSERDGPAIHIDFVAIEAEFLLDGEILCGEGFIYFDQINVIQRQPGFLQSDLRGRNWAAAHKLRLNTRDPPADDSAHRLDAALVGFFKRHDNDCRGPVNNAAGVAGGDSTVLAECWF